MFNNRIRTIVLLLVMLALLAVSYITVSAQDEPLFGEYEARFLVFDNEEVTAVALGSGVTSMRATSFAITWNSDVAPNAQYVVAFSRDEILASGYIESGCYELEATFEQPAVIATAATDVYMSTVRAALLNDLHGETMTRFTEVDCPEVIKPELPFEVSAEFGSVNKGVDTVAVIQTGTYYPFPNTASLGIKTFGKGVIMVGGVSLAPAASNRGQLEYFGHPVTQNGTMPQNAIFTTLFEATLISRTWGASVDSVAETVPYWSAGAAYTPPKIDWNAAIEVPISGE